VLAALAANVTITIAKGVAAVLTGSAALRAEFASALRRRSKDWRP
jgi:hypothetical protein